MSDSKNSHLKPAAACSESNRTEPPAVQKKKNSDSKGSEPTSPRALWKVFSMIAKLSPCCCCCFCFDRWKAHCQQKCQTFAAPILPAMEPAQLWYIAQGQLKLVCLSLSGRISPHWNWKPSNWMTSRPWSNAPTSSSALLRMDGLFRFSRQPWQLQVISWASFSFLLSTCWPWGYSSDGPGLRSGYYAAWSRGIGSPFMFAPYLQQVRA